MESSAERALEIGLNVFVFIIALSCAIVLMTNVLNMSELASTIIKDTGNSTLMELYGDTTERIYSGDEMFAIINEYLADTNKIKERIVLKINKNGLISNVIEAQVLLSEFNDSYNLTYGGTEVDVNNISREIYIFSKVESI